MLASKQKSFFSFSRITDFRDFALRPYAKKKFYYLIEFNYHLIEFSTCT